MTENTNKKINETITIPMARGDGIGPEIMDACLNILIKAGARINPIFIEIGEKIYLKGNTAGIENESWDLLKKHKIFYKAPITTPQGGGYKSLNVTIRKTLSLYSNIRPVMSYNPYIPIKHENIDVVIIRENEEDLYAGIEHQQTPEVTQCLKLISRPGCEKIVRYAFEYAKAYNRKKVTCMTKDNIMKITDGLFHKVFKEIALEYPEIESEHWIIDIGTAKLADSPEMFDVVVMPNLYGDIASDMLGQIAGSVGLAPGANIGDDYAMFEAIHGSAPKHAGQNKANPSGLLLAGIMMMVHIGQPDIAEKIHNAWFKTIEDKIWTYDIVRKAKAGGIKEYTEVGTKEFADAVIERLGSKPIHFKPVKYSSAVFKVKKPKLTDLSSVKMELDGVDVFIEDGKITPNELGLKLDAISGDKFSLIMISNRGQKVYPNYSEETFCTDHWRCRFQPPESINITNSDIRKLLERIEKANLNWIKLENLYFMDGERAYTLGQGQ